jgi:hypothetical protein
VTTNLSRVCVCVFVSKKTCTIFVFVFANLFCYSVIRFSHSLYIYDKSIYTLFSPLYMYAALMWPRRR